MSKLLINAPTGEQRIETIGDGGDYYDATRVIWDERVHGGLPAVTLGKMRRTGNLLETLADYLPDHAAWMAEQQIVIDAATKKTAMETETKNDGDLAALRPMSGEEINAWFDVNITNLNQTIKMLKKIVKSLVKQNSL